MKRLFPLLLSLCTNAVAAAPAVSPHVARSSSKPLKIETELIAFWDDLREHDPGFQKQFDQLTRWQQTKYGAMFDASGSRIPQVVPWWPCKSVLGISFLLNEEGTYLVVFPTGKGGEMTEELDGGVVAQFHVRYHATSKLGPPTEGSVIREELVTNTLELTFEGFRLPILQPVTSP